MENNLENNRVIISGFVRQLPEYSHSIFGETFLRFLLAVPRLSGVEDELPVTTSERLLRFPLTEGDAVTVSGQLRSYNMQSTGGNRLLVTVFARHIEHKDEAEPFQNEIFLSGYICKPPAYRMTPFSREITDLLLAVNRPYHKSDYLPVIVWGRNARYVGGLLTGDKLHITGRVQSRVYQKTLTSGEVVSRVAYEVSAATVERDEDSPPEDTQTAH